MFRGLRRTLFTLAIGAALAYYWDPENGEERRAQFMEQFQGLMQQGQGLMQQGQQRVQEMRDSASNGNLGSQSPTSASSGSTTYAQP